MKRSNIVLGFLALAAMLFSACEDRDYPAGLTEYDHHYYLGYLPFNNTAVASVNRTQTELVAFEVQFNSAFTRDYDAVAQYTLVTTGIAAPAVLGQDFVITDKNGVTLTPVDGKYSLTFPKAERKKDFIYAKVLNSAVPGTRRIEIHIVENKQSQYFVDTFSQAFKRTLEVK